MTTTTASGQQVDRRVKLESRDDISLVDAVVDALAGPHGRLVHCPTRDGDLWRYDVDRGIWRPFPPNPIGKLLTDWARRGIVYPDVDDKGITVWRPVKVSNSKIEAVTKWIRRDSFAPDFFAPSIGKVGFANGTLCVDFEAEDLVLRPHDPGNRLRHAYDFEWRGFVGDADVPESNVWGSFMKPMLSAPLSADDMLGQFIALHEWLGAAILGLGPRYGRALLLYGGAGTGKSQMLNIIRGLFPESAITSIGPHRWSERFNLIMLHGKRLNVVPELPDKNIIKTDLIKAVIHGEPVTDSLKNKDQITFEPVAAHAWSANRLPRLSSAHAAVYDRMLVIELRNRFRGDPKREVLDVGRKMLAAHREFLVHFALSYFVSLMKRGRYELPGPHRAIVAQWRTASDTVAGWLEERAELLPDPTGSPVSGWASLKAAYDDYIDYCAESGHTMKANKHSFKARVAELGVDVGKSNGVRLGLVLKSQPLTLADVTID